MAATAESRLNIFIVAKNLTSNAMKKIQKDLKTLGKSMETVGKQMKEAGTIMTKAFTVPLTAISVAALKMAIDFETAFTGVRKTVNATEEEFKELEKGIREMALRIPASTEEIAGVAEAAGQLGVKTKDILAFTEVMINLGNTTNLSANEAAVSLARFMTVMGTSKNDVGKLGSVIVDLGNNFETTESEILMMASRLKNSGKIIGLSESQILGMAAALTSVDINAEAGGTAFSKLMIKIASAVDEGGDKLNNFAEVADMSASDFQTAFKTDAGGAIIDFVEGLGRVKESGKSTFAVMEELGLSEVRLRNALLGVSQAGDKLRDATDRGSEAWEKNEALAKEAELRYKTTASQLRILWNRIKDVGLSLGEELIPMLIEGIKKLEPFINQLKKAVTWFGNLEESTKKLFVGSAAVLAIGGPALLALGALTAAMGFFVTTMLPIIVVIAGITAAIGNVIIIYKKWSDIIKILQLQIKTFFKNISILWQTSKKWVVDAMEFWTEKILGTFKTILKWTAKLPIWLGGETATAWQEELSAIIVGTKAWGAEITIQADKSIDANVKTLKKIEIETDKTYAEIAKKVIEDVSGFIKAQDTKNVVVETSQKKQLDDINKTSEGIKKNQDEQLTKVIDVTKLQRIAVEGVTNSIKRLWNNTQTTFNDVWKGALDSFVDVMGEMFIQAKFTFEGIKIEMAAATAGLSLVIGLLGMALGGLGSRGGGNAIKSAAERMKEVFDTFIDNLDNSIKQFGLAIDKSGKRVITATEKEREIINDVVQQLSKIQAVAGTAEGGLLTSLPNEFKDVTDKVLSELFTTLSKKTTELNEIIFDRYAKEKQELEKVRDTIDNIGDTIAKLQNSQKDFISSIGKDIQNVERITFTPLELLDALTEDAVRLSKELQGLTGDEKITGLEKLRDIELLRLAQAEKVFEGVGSPKFLKIQEEVLTSLNKIQTEGETEFDRMITIQLDQLEALTGLRDIEAARLNLENVLFPALAGTLQTVLGELALLGTGDVTKIDDISELLKFITPEIVPFANGGIATSPTLAVVGEQPEAMVPLKNGKIPVDLGSSEDSNSNASVTFNINIQAWDGEDVERTVNRAIVPAIVTNIKDLGDMKTAILEVVNGQ